MAADDRLRQAMRGAIHAHNELLEAWRSWSKEGKPPLHARDAPLLQELIYQRIYSINAFEALAQLDTHAAISGLLRRYLGEWVDPDRGFGGFAYDLDSMLSDLVETGGEEALLTLLRQPQFNRGMLGDPRFVESVVGALRIEPGAFPSWLSAHGLTNPPAG